MRAKLKGKKKMQIMRIKNKNKYVKIVDPPPWREPPRPNFIYVCTVTLWPTSIFGQIETCGWIESDKLEALPTKQHKKIERQYQALLDRQNERSEAWHNIYKSTKGEK